MIEHAEAGHKDKQPQRGGTHHRDNHREEKGGAQPAVHAVVLPQRDGQQQRQRNTGEHRQQDVEQVIEQRLPEDAVCQQAGKVSRADKGRVVARQARVKQAVVDRAQQGKVGEQRQEQQRRRENKPGKPVLFSVA